MYGKNYYKGHRYVPLIVGQWDNTKKTEYEALSVVLWKGNSYTSKKFVPRGVDITNEYYWVCTGNYNAQVELYRRELNNKIDKRNIVNNLLDGGEDKVLSAEQGRVLNINMIENNNKFKKLINDISVNVIDFGAKGDGVTDDWNSLKNAIEYAKSIKKPIKLSGKHYVSKTVDFTGIEYVIGNGCNDSILYDKRMYNGEIIGHKWFSDNRPPYKIFVDGLEGDLICSDTANPIVVCTSEDFKTNGIGIYGWYGNADQIGFTDYKSEPTKYSGTIKEFNNTKIKYCGSHGMHLKRGIEYFNPIGLECRDNGGYGLFVERKLAINPCEYSNFLNCRFDNNYLDGVYLKGFKKSIKFDSCQFSRQGQYHL